jgi:hypothetical protein
MLHLIGDWSTWNRRPSVPTELQPRDLAGESVELVVGHVGQWPLQTRDEIVECLLEGPAFGLVESPVFHRLDEKANRVPNSLVKPAQTMRRAPFLLLLLGCAHTTGATSEQVARQPAVYESRETGVVFGDRPKATTVATPASPDVAATAVRLVFKQLDIPVLTDNPATHQIGNNDFYRTRMLAGKSMTDWLNCGQSMTGPKAASYRIYLSVLTDVIPDGHGGTNLHTLLVAHAQDMAGTSDEAILCGSTGKFERMFLDRVLNLIGK